MKLDNRPKRLLVRGVSSEKLQALRDWYEVRPSHPMRPLRDADSSLRQMVRLTQYLLWRMVMSWYRSEREQQQNRFDMHLYM